MTKTTQMKLELEPEQIFSFLLNPINPSCFVFFLNQTAVLFLLHFMPVTVIFMPCWFDYFFLQSD